MSSDLQRLMRAVKIIAKLAWKYRQQDVAAALLKHYSQRERGDVPLAGQFLTDLWDRYQASEREAEPRCLQCGESVHDTKDNLARADARYCSPKCRQRAYRKRVTARCPDGRQKHNEASSRDASNTTSDGQA